MYLLLLLLSFSLVGTAPCQTDTFYSLVPKFSGSKIYRVESDSRKLYGCSIPEAKDCHIFFMYVLYSEPTSIIEIVQKAWDLFGDQTLRVEFYPSLVGQLLKKLIQLCGEFALSPEAYSPAQYCLDQALQTIEEWKHRLHNKQQLTPQEHVIQNIIKTVQEYKYEYKRASFYSYFIFKEDYSKQLADLGIAILGVKMAIDLENKWITKMVSIPDNPEQIHNNLSTIHKLKCFLPLNKRYFVPTNTQAGLALKELVDVMPPDLELINLQNLIKEGHHSYLPDYNHHQLLDELNTRHLIACCQLKGFNRSIIDKILTWYTPVTQYTYSKCPEKDINILASYINILKTYLKYITALKISGCFDESLETPGLITHL